MLEKPLRISYFCTRIGGCLRSWALLPQCCLFFCVLLFVGLSTAQSKNEPFNPEPRKTCQVELAPSFSVELNYREASADPTLRVIEVREGLYGGGRLLVERVGDHWISQWSVSNFDPQGDPRWFILALGKEVAKFFGFEIISDSQIIIPSGEEFFGAVARLNNYLKEQGKEPLALNLKEVDLSTSKLSGYLNLFRQSLLPIALGGNEFFHDISFHTGAIFIPPRWARIAQLRVGFVVDFLKYLSARPHAYAKEINGIKKHVKHFLVRGVDNGTAFGAVVNILNQQRSLYLNHGLSFGAVVVDRRDYKVGYFEAPTASNLILGFTGDVNESADPVDKYFFPRTSTGRITLDDYTLHLVQQFWNRFVFQKGESGGVPSALLIAQNNQRYSWLRRQLKDFSKTAEGENWNLNLTGELFLQPDFQMPPRSVENFPRSSGERLRQEFFEQVLLVNRSVKELLRRKNEQ